MLKLFLDDIRNKPDNSWILVKNYNEFCSFIEKAFRNFQIIDVISFDHDLALEHYTFNDEDLENNDYINSKNTGYHCALFLINFYTANSIDMPKIYVHSMNPIGVNNICKLFNNIGINTFKILPSHSDIKRL